MAEPVGKEFKMLIDWSAFEFGQFGRNRSYWHLRKHEMTIEWPNTYDRPSRNLQRKSLNSAENNPDSAERNS